MQLVQKFSATPKGMVAQINRTLRTGLVLNLRAVGIEAFCAEDSLTILSKAIQMPTDLLLIDFRLADSNGPQVIKFIRAAERGDRHMPIIAVGVLRPGEREQFEKAGADSVIDLNELDADILSTVEKFLTRANRTCAC